MKSRYHIHQVVYYQQMTAEVVAINSTGSLTIELRTAPAPYSVKDRLVVMPYDLTAFVV